VAPAIIAALSLIGYALLPRMKARLLIPLSLSFGTLVTGWSMWVAGTLISTRASFVVAAALFIVSLRALPRWWRDCRRVLRELVALGRRWTTALLILPLLLALPQLALPIVDSDGLRYHVAFPKLFLLTGKVFYYPWDLTGAFPQTAEMIYMLRPESAKLIHFSFFLATLATLALAVHRRRRDRTAAVVAPFLLAVSPVVLGPAAAAFIDHVVLFHVAVAMLLLLSRRPPALPLAAAFATKYAAAPAVAVLALAQTPLPAPRGEGGALRLRSGQAPRRVRGAILTLAVILAAFLPFAIRNTLHSGDPIYPIGHVLLHKPLEGIAPGSLAYATQFHSRAAGVVGIPWTPENAQPDEVVGIHHLLGHFALILVLRERRLRPVAAIVFVYLLVALVYRLPARYMLPMFLALALLEAAALALLPRRLIGIVALVVALPALLWSATLLLTMSSPFTYLRGRLDRAHYLALVVPGYRAAQFVNALPPGGQVMALDFPAPYYFDRPWIVEGVLHDPPLKRWLATARSADDLLARLRALDVRVLVVTPGYGGGTPSTLLPLASTPEQARLVDHFRRRLRLLATVDRVDVFAVPR
jgi:hypothetical protein